MNSTATTRERLLEYQRLRRVDPAAAASYLKCNEDDERFQSLAKLGEAFVEGFHERLRVSLSEENREILAERFQAAFITGWTELASFASATAKESARRVLA